MQVFNHVAYVEDGRLCLGIRSNEEFPLCSVMEDTDWTPFYLYTTVDVGEGVYVNGTIYSVAPGNKCWYIVVAGEVIEQIELDV